MSAVVVAHERPSKRRIRAKTGCATCRIRKIKCDEIKPFCRKCTSTGRTCDGYESPFRFHSSKTTADGANRNEAVHSSPKPILAATNTVTEQDIYALNRCFSVKTVFDIELACDMEAKQVLEAGLTDLSIQHAVSALRALRHDFERPIKSEMGASQPSLSYNRGLIHYCAALKAVTASQSTASIQGLRSTLLCCQVFICIEQVQQNYATMAQHVTQGLNIMHQFRARPCVDDNSNFMLAHDAPLPLLDVFLIKMFSAPCKFADASVGRPADGDATPSCPILAEENMDGRSSHRTIAPDMRAGLTKIAASILEFLKNVSQATTKSKAIKLLSEKDSLQRSLDSWAQDLSGIYPTSMTPETELISISFMRLFHQTLQIVVLGALETSSDLSSRLKIEGDNLQSIASKLGGRLEAFRLGDTPR